MRCGSTPTGSFSRLDVRKLDAVPFHRRPVNVALVARDIDTERGCLSEGGGERNGDE